MPISNPGLGPVTGLTPEQEQTLLFLEYNPTTDLMVSTKTLQTTVNSLLLGEQHSITSGDENVYFANLESEVSFFPPWSGIKRQEIPANQDSTGIVPLFVRKHSSDLLTASGLGPVAASGSVPFGRMFTTVASVVSFGFRVKLQQSLAIGNCLTYTVSSMGGNVVFGQVTVIDAPYAVGDLLEIWYNTPSETFPGATVISDIQVESAVNAGDFTPLMVYPADSAPTEHWSEVFFRTFTDETLDPDAEPNQTDAEIKTQYEANADTNAFTDAYESKLASLDEFAEQNVQADWNTTDDTLDSYIKNKPADLGYILATYGSNLQNTGNHPRINGVANGVQVGGLGIDASAVVPADGTIEAVTYFMDTGNNTTVFEIIKNGVVAHTFTCVGPDGVETGINVSVSVGDNVALRYDSGMTPAGSIYNIYVK